MVPYLNEKSIHFHEGSHKSSRNNNLHTADPTRLNRACGYPGEVDLWTREFGIEDRSVWLSMSQRSGLQRTLWSPLSSAWLTVGNSARFLSHQSRLSLEPYSSFPRQTLSGPESHLLQKWILKSFPLNSSPQYAWRIIWEPLLTFLTIGDTTKLLTVGLITTGTASGNGDWAWAYKPGKYPQKLSKLLSSTISVFWLASLWFQLFTCVLRIVEFSFPPLEYIIQ